MSAPSVAQALGVSLTTVKTHLGRCFDKMAVRSQVELALLVSRLPAGVGIDGKMVGELSAVRRRMFDLD